MKVVVIGAGAAGTVAAIEAAKAGNEVVVLELKEEAMKKIYATGNGRCNLTNKNIDVSYYRSDDLYKLKDILEKYDSKWLLDYMEKQNLYTTSIGDYYYPNSKQASTVVDVLFYNAKKYGVVFEFNCNVKNIEPKNKGIDGFLVKTIVTENKRNTKKEFECDRIIVACGGKAAPKLGSDGSGYYLMSKLGHRINDVVPALVPLLCDDRRNGKILSIMQKVRADARVSVCVDGIEKESVGEIQMTEYGVSGIVVFQLSAYIAKQLKDKEVDIYIDFLPDYEEIILKNILTNLLESYVENDIKKGIHKGIYKGLSCLLNDKISMALVEELDFICNDGIIKCYKENFTELVNRLCKLIKNYRLAVTGTKDFDSAQVCSGGVSFKEVDERMESKLVKNMFIVGELLDVDGVCGGYNLHFAFVSGIIAARSIN